MAAPSSTLTRQSRRSTSRSVVLSRSRRLPARAFGKPSLSSLATSPRIPRFGGSSTSNPIPAATSRTPIGYLSVGGDLTFGFGLLSFDTRSLAFAFGQDELETGAGSASDPYQTVISQESVGAHGILCFRARGVRKDGMIIEVDFNDVTIDAAADVNISGKTVRPIAVGGRCTSHIMRAWTA
jgi:hypothetical protein